MAGKPQAEKAVERFPELGCFAVAVRRIVYADASAEPCVLFCYRGRSRNHTRGANCRDAEGSRSA